MNTLQTIMQHRSIRKYKPQPITEEVLKQILEAGFRASTTGNMQVYSIIVTQDTDKKAELAKFHFGQKMITEAPIVLTFCADFNRFNKWCEFRDAEPRYDNFLSFTTAAIDALLAAQNVCIAAESLGLGICYLGTTTYLAEQIANFFSCPEGVVPITTITMGYPDEAPELTDRLPFEGIVHFEQYQDYTRESIDKIYAAKEALPLTQKLLEDNQLGNLAKIFTQKRYTKKDNIAFSKAFLEFLSKTGFMNQ